MKKLPFHETVALKLIEQLKQRTAPWVKPWNPGDPNLLMPTNPLTGKRYRGINALHLMAQDYPDNRWMTYNQAIILDAQVKKGEKATIIQYWKFAEEKAIRDEQGNLLLDRQGQSIKEKILLERPQVFYAAVFNACQIEGLPPLELKQKSWPQLERAEALLQQSGAIINHSEIDKAYYKPSTDRIHLPPKHQFEEAARYYATALHELAHWTGHPSRLNRELSHPFGSEAYAKEELRAEIASMLLGEELNIGHDPAQHVAYIQSWIRILEEDSLEIFRAAADAEKIHSHLLSLEQKLEQTHTTESLKEEIIIEIETMPSPLTTEKIRLIIPYEQKDKAKALLGHCPDGKPAISWDRKEKCWFANPGVSLDQLKPWLPENNPLTQEPGLSPIQEFSDQLRSLGCILSDNHPIMDGQTHRITVEGDKPGERAGFYIAHLDGHPAGYIKNNRTGKEIKWKSKGYSFTEAEKKNLHDQLQSKIEERQLARIEAQEKAALRVNEQLAQLQPLQQPTPYCKAKGIPVFRGVFTDKDNSTTYVPVFDAQGKIWSMQYIQADGVKRFAKNSRKEGCFHPVGGFEALVKAPALLIAEGYATAATAAQAVGFATVAAFDAGNLKAVALALKLRFPEKPIIILGDDDKALEMNNKVNTGKFHAELAAKSVGGHVLFPVFSSAKYYSNEKKLSDFNDLANNSKLGITTVKAQIKQFRTRLTNYKTLR